MVLQQLLDLLVNGHAFQIRIVLLELQTLGGVLAVLGRDVTADAGNASTLLLGALENDLHAIAFCFLCHNTVTPFLLVNNHDFGEVSVGGSLLQGGVKTHLVDVAQSGSRYSEAYPLILLGPIELAVEDVNVEFTFRPALGVRHVVARDRLLSGDLTNFRHSFSFCLVIVLVLHSLIGDSLATCLPVHRKTQAQHNIPGVDIQPWRGRSIPPV